MYVVWELDYKEGWEPKNLCFLTVVLEKTFESHLDSKEIKPVNPKGNQPWIFIGRTDAEAEAPIIWPTCAKSQLIGKHPDTGKDWGQGEKGTKEDEMVGWHHWLNGHEFEQGHGKDMGRTRKPRMLQSMGLQRVGHDWAAKQQQALRTMSLGRFQSWENSLDTSYLILTTSCSFAVSQWDLVTRTEEASLLARTALSLTSACIW